MYLFISKAITVGKNWSLYKTVLPIKIIMIREIENIFFRVFSYKSVKHRKV